MEYEFRQVFCATAASQEAERTAFHDALAELNESEAMATNILLVPLSLTPNMIDKRAFQSAVTWNIRQSSLYLQVFDGDWGPPERNFEADYAFALQCLEDPASPMQHAALLPSAPIEQFKQNLRLILDNWFQTITSSNQKHAEAVS